MAKKNRHSPEDVAFAREYLRKALSAGSALYMIESYGKDGPNGTPCQVRTFAVVDGRIECLTHYTLKVCNEPMRDSKRLGGVWVHLRCGGGYSRAQSVADHVFSEVFGYQSEEYRRMKWYTL